MKDKVKEISNGIIEYKGVVYYNRLPVAPVNLRDELITLLCEIAIHVGLPKSKPTIENVIRGLKKGHEIGTVNISLTGKDGGKIKPISDININSSSFSTPRIQECHMVAYHIICELVEAEMAKN